MKDDQNISLICALGYARQYSFAVLPVMRRSKRPLTRHGVHDATTDETTIKRWWQKWPDANVGIATGKPSQIIVVDLDAPDGSASLARLERKYQSLPKTLTCVTGGGGQHFYFSYEPGIASGVALLGRGLDVKADGGYVVAPPSLHPNGHQYVWVRRDVRIAGAPLWLVNLLRRDIQLGQLSSLPRAVPQLAQSGAEEGSRNDTITRLVGHLLGHRVDPYVALDLVLAWNREKCAPPLDDDEVVRIVNSICGRELKRRGG